MSTSSYAFILHISPLIKCMSMEMSFRSVDFRDCTVCLLETLEGSITPFCPRVGQVLVFDYLDTCMTGETPD